MGIVLVKDPESASGFVWLQDGVVAYKVQIWRPNLPSAIPIAKLGGGNRQRRGSKTLIVVELEGEGEMKGGKSGNHGVQILNVTNLCQMEIVSCRRLLGHGTEEDSGRPGMG